MLLQPHVACMALKRKLEATGRRVHPALSIVGWFFPLPELSYAGDSVAPAVSPLALVAARVPRAGNGEGGQNGSRHATIPDGPAAVRPVGKWPRCGAPTRLFHGAPSDSPAEFKPCSTSQRSPIPARQRGSASSVPSRITCVTRMSLRQR